MSFTNPQRIINKQFDAFVAGGNNITKSIAPDMATMQKHIAEQKKYTRDLEQRDQQTGFKLRSSLNELGTTGNRVLDENIQVFWNEQVDNYFKIKNVRIRSISCSKFRSCLTTCREKCTSFNYRFTLFSRIYSKI